MLEFKHPEYAVCEIGTYNTEIESKIKSKFDSYAMPIDGLGKLEDTLARIGAIQNDVKAELDPAVAVIFFGDHGVVSEGVSQSNAEVTLAIAKGIAEGRSVINHFAKAAGCRVLPVDCGISLADEIPGVLDRKIEKGTDNLFKGPAMSKANARKAITTGFEMARELKEDGTKLILAGEMGMGGTTSAAAILCGLTGEYPELVVGRGSGLSDDAYNSKTLIVRSVMQHRCLTELKPVELLAQVGGFEIGALAGLFIGGAAFGIPVISDGLVTGTAALLAARIRPGIEKFVIFSQRGREPGIDRILKEFDAEPSIDAGVVMEEAIGGALLLSLLRPVKDVYDNGSFFADKDVQPFKRYRSMTQNHYE